MRSGVAGDMLICSKTVWVVSVYAAFNAIGPTPIPIWAKSTKQLRLLSSTTSIHDGHGKILQVLLRRVSVCWHNRPLPILCLIFFGFCLGFLPFYFATHHPLPSHTYTHLFLLNLAHPHLFGFFFQISLPSSTNSFVLGLLHISILSPHATLTNTPNNGDQGVRHHLPSHLKSHTSNTRVQNIQRNWCRREGITVQDRH